MDNKASYVAAAVVGNKGLVPVFVVEGTASSEFVVALVSELEPFVVVIELAVAVVAEWVPVVVELELELELVLVLVLEPVLVQAMELVIHGAVIPEVQAQGALLLPSLLEVELVILSAV